MPDVVKHAWTHRPRSQGGTDPIQIDTGGTTWATTFGSGTAITHVSNDYWIPLHQMWTNDSAGFELTGISGSDADYLQINNPGYYTIECLVTRSGGFLDNFTRPRVEVLFDLSGGFASMVPNMGPADFPGAYLVPVSELENGSTDYGALYTRAAFHWDPASPDAGDLSDQDPLKVTCNLTTTASTATLNLLSQMLVKRIAGPGYSVTDLF
jgi:hypothetical protein